MRAVDKTSKKSHADILTEFEGKGYDRQKLETILEFSSVRGTISEVEGMFDTANLEFWDHLKQIIDSLGNRGVSNVRINFGIVRGLDYYSGTVFEVFAVGSGLGALAGGGRYDTLTTAFERDDIGACGVAGGVERMILTMHEQGLVQATGAKRIAVLYVNSDMQKVASSITSLLRLNGIHADMDLAGRSLKKQMNGAGGARLALIVGPQELADGGVVLRDMQDGTEGIIQLEKLTEDPRSVLSLERPA